MDIEYKLAELADADALIEAQDLAFYEDYIKYGACPGYGHTKESMEHMIAGAFVYKILCDGKTIGNMIVRDKGNGEYHLGGLCVIPEYENRGIGQQSIRFMEQQFPNAKYFTLVTPADKYRNHYFYEKMGFVKVGELVDCNVALYHYKKIINL